MSDPSGDFYVAEGDDEYGYEMEEESYVEEVEYVEEDEETEASPAPVRRSTRRENRLPSALPATAGDSSESEAESEAEAGPERKATRVSRLPTALTNDDSKEEDDDTNKSAFDHHDICPNTNSVLCCWGRDRQSNDDNGDCKENDCEDADPADNTDLYVQILRISVLCVRQLL